MPTSAPSSIPQRCSEPRRGGASQPILPSTRRADTRRSSWCALESPGGLIAIFLSGLLVIVGALPVMGYQLPIRARVFLSGPSVVRCDQSAKIVARVIDIRTKKPVRGQRVKWSFAARQSGKDRLSPRVTTTNSQGIARTRVSSDPRLASVSSRPIAATPRRSSASDVPADCP